MSDSRADLVESSEHYYLSMIPLHMTAELRKRYAESHRRYHTWEHVRELFRLLEEVDENVACLPAVILAVLFHDAVYDPRRRNNENRSVALMKSLWKRELDLYWFEKAETLILATINHSLPEGHAPSGDVGYFLDMDMAILGSSPERYEEYVRQIREEYGSYSDKDFYRRRAEFLRETLSRERIFSTSWGVGRFEEAARRNIAGELERIGKVP